jgi:hypothetical protein
MNTKIQTWLYSQTDSVVLVDVQRMPHPARRVGRSILSNLSSLITLWPGCNFITGLWPPLPSPNDAGNVTAGLHHLIDPRTGQSAQTTGLAEMLDRVEPAGYVN